MKGETVRAILCLEDGFYTTGVFAGTPREVCGEVAFCTGTAYDVIMRDSAYSGKLLVFAFPMIGTYNLDPKTTSATVSPRAVVARDIWQGHAGDNGITLLDKLNQASVPALTGVDTRGLVRHLTGRASMRGIVAQFDQSDSATIQPTYVEALVRRIGEEMAACPKTDR